MEKSRVVLVLIFFFLVLYMWHRLEVLYLQPKSERLKLQNKELKDCLSEKKGEVPL